jgi:hypothetical protein
MNEKKYQSQLALIRAVLKTDKKITRNYCLARHISRLGSRIKDLEYLKWKFDRGYIGADRGDYEYRVVKVGE